MKIKTQAQINKNWNKSKHRNINIGQKKLRINLYTQLTVNLIQLRVKLKYN